MSGDLAWAAKNGDLDALKSLENNAAEVNKQLEDGRYLLHHAADYGQREVIEYLLSQGASVNVSLADYGQKAVIEYLLSQGADVNVSLADYGQKAVIEYLLSKSANVNQTDKHEITPLCAAVFEGHTECVQVLLAKGADKTVKAPSGESMIEVAEKQEIKDLLQ